MNQIRLSRFEQMHLARSLLQELIYSFLSFTPFRQRILVRRRHGQKGYLNNFHARRTSALSKRKRLFPFHARRTSALSKRNGYSLSTQGAQVHFLNGTGFPV